jgi:hypothetical protein
VPKYSKKTEKYLVFNYFPFDTRKVVEEFAFPSIEVKQRAKLVVLPDLRSVKGKLYFWK